jgi:hypothetical protein
MSTERVVKNIPPFVGATIRVEAEYPEMESDFPANPILLIEIMPFFDDISYIGRT